MLKKSQLVVSKLLHISTIRNHPQGLKNRFVEEDNYIKKQNYQKVKTYSDFVHKKSEMEKVKVFIPEKDEQYIFSSYSRVRKNAVWLKRLIIPLQRNDDHESGENYEHKTLLSFTKQALKKREPHHMYYLSIIAALITYPIIYLFYWRYEQFDQQTMMLTNPEKAETYSLHQCHQYTKEFNRKIQAYVKELKQQKTLIQ